MQPKFAIFALVFSLLLAACQPSTPTPAPIPTAPPTPAPTPTDEPIVIPADIQALIAQNAAQSAGTQSAEWHLLSGGDPEPVGAAIPKPDDPTQSEFKLVGANGESITGVTGVEVVYADEKAVGLLAHTNSGLYFENGADGKTEWQPLAFSPAAEALNPQGWGFVVDEAGNQYLIDPNHPENKLTLYNGQFVTQAEYDQAQLYSKYPDLKAFVESGGLLDFENGFAYEAETGKVAWLQHPESYEPDPNGWYPMETPGTYTFQLKDNQGTIEMPIFPNVEAAYAYIFAEIQPIWGGGESWLGVKEDEQFAEKVKYAVHYDENIQTTTKGKLYFCLADKDCSKAINRVKVSYQKYILDDGQIVLRIVARKTGNTKSHTLLVLCDPDEFHQQMQANNQVIITK